MPRAKSRQGSPGSLSGVKLREGLAVALGGALGTLARVGADEALVGITYGAHLATLTVNILGAFGLAFVVAHGVPRWGPALRAGISVGFFGSYTTFSAISLLVITSNTLEAIGYLALTFGLGIAAAVLGWKWGTRARTQAAVDA